MDSIWASSCKLPRAMPQSADVKTDAVVIGAGMAGLLTACKLKERGLKVIVIDAGEIAHGVSANTTAKITAQHRLIYDRLLTSFHKRKARQYADANQAAIEEYARMVSAHGIDCDFERKDAYVYTLGHAGKPAKIAHEAQAARALGIPAELVGGVDLPLPVTAAVKFPNQAQFHPLKFLCAISDGLTIFTHTRALSIESSQVITDHGKISADFIVVATHYPLCDFPGYYFLRLHQSRSYVLALTGCKLPDGMFIDESESGLSFRSFQNLLLLGGAGHRTGKNEAGGCYDTLRGLARKLYPGSREVAHWSAQDCMTLDGVPYIGQYSTKSLSIYVATGFNKWGMTGAMAAAMILSDTIGGVANPWAEVFSPQRFNLTASMKNLIADGASTAAGLARQGLTLPKETVNKLPNGHGGIVEYNNTKVGVYKNERGEVFVVDITCPHMGCQLTWNPDELSWDCPCHGSRFDYKGHLLNNPATEDITNDQFSREQ